MNWRAVNLLTRLIATFSGKGTPYAHTILGKYPSIYDRTLRKVSPPKGPEMVVSPDTDFVIEGFPRSANTFAKVYFNLMTECRFVVAHHVHFESQIRRGIALGKPVLVLLRNPRDAVRSLVVMDEGWSLHDALCWWLDYYGYVLRHRSQLSIARFEDMVNDPVTVFRDWKEQCSACFQVREVLMSEVYAHIEEYDGELGSKSKLPNSVKEQRKARIAFESLPSGTQRVLSRCESVFSQLQR